MDAHNPGSTVSEDSSGSTGTPAREQVGDDHTNASRRPRAQVPEDGR